MAKVKTIFDALRVDLLPNYGQNVAPEPTKITVSDDNGNTYIFRGNFTYDQNGPHGTVTSVEYLIDGKVNFRVNDFSVPVEPLFSPDTTIYDAVQYVLGGDDLVYGRDGNDTLAAGGGADRIYGRAGDDVIFAESGNDLLLGEAGNDILIGGNGADRLRGGEGGDVFAYLFATDSTFAGSGRDRILDFDNTEGDFIDLRAIDGSFQRELTQVNTFTGSAGELLIRSLGADQYAVLVDLDGNGKADFAINVTTRADSMPLTANDFLL